MRYRPHVLQLEPRDLAAAYTVGVGPGQMFATPDLVPWSSLRPDTEVDIYWQSTPYHSKIDVDVGGHLVIKGIPNASGQLPVIDGNGAVENRDAHYGDSGTADKGVFTITPAVYGGPEVNDVTIEYLQIQGGDYGNPYTRWDGTAGSYYYAAGVAMYRATDVTVDHCVITQNDNGIFGKSYGFSGGDLVNITVSNNQIFANGWVGDAGTDDTYIEGWYTRYVYNHYGQLRPGAGGNCIKDRSVQPVVAFNYIDGGSNQLDLVDPDDGAGDMVGGTEWVYGNVLVNHGQGRRVVNFGWDQAQTGSQKTLYFYSNTVIFQNSYPDGDGQYYTELLKQMGGTTAYVFDNVVSQYSPIGEWPGYMYLSTTEYGTAVCYFGVNVVPVAGNLTWDSAVTYYGTNNLVEAEAGLVNQAGGDYRLSAGSPAVGSARGYWDGTFHQIGLPAVDHQPDWTGGSFHGFILRPDQLDCGAIADPVSGPLESPVAFNWPWANGGTYHHWSRRSA